MLQRVQKVPVIPRERSDRGNPFPQENAVFSQNSIIAEHFGERIATPVCALARNDRFFDSLKHLPQASAFFLEQGTGIDYTMELPPSSWRQADAHRASAFRWVRFPSTFPKRTASRTAGVRNTVILCVIYYGIRPAGVVTGKPGDTRLL